MTPETVRELIDTGPRTAPQAREVGLVDSLGYRDQAYAAMRSRVGPDAELLFADRWSPPRRPHVPARRKGHVALVEVHGAIASGRSSRGPMGRQVGSDSIGAALRAATADENTRAVVLHIDSPGGSAVASDTIWREVCQVREAGKPVIVSMGAAAASGGYYIACPADAIVALPSTLTGSIGVFGGQGRRPRPDGATRADHRDGLPRRAIPDVLGAAGVHRRRARAARRHAGRDLHRLRRQGRAGARQAGGGDRGHRPGPGVDRDRRPAHRPRRRVGRVARRTADRPIPRRAPERRTASSVRCTYPRWPGWDERGTARTHARRSAPPLPGLSDLTAQLGLTASTELRMPDDHPALTPAGSRRARSAGAPALPQRGRGGAGLAVPHQLRLDGHLVGVRRRPRRPEAPAPDPTGPVAGSAGRGPRSRTAAGHPAGGSIPSRCARWNTAAPLWQSRTVAMIPPLRNPNPLSCSGHGSNAAVTKPSPG